MDRNRSGKSSCAVVQWRRRWSTSYRLGAYKSKRELPSLLQTQSPKRGRRQTGAEPKGCPKIAPVECATGTRTENGSRINRKWVRFCSCGRGHSPIFAAAAECFGNGRCKHIKKMLFLRDTISISEAYSLLYSSTNDQKGGE